MSLENIPDTMQFKFMLFYPWYEQKMINASSWKVDSFCWKSYKGYKPISKYCCEVFHGVIMFKFNPFGINVTG